MVAEPSTGVPVVDAAVAWSLAGAAVFGLMALVWRGVRALHRIANRLDDVFGAPARDGQPGKPGLVERVGRLESEVSGWGRLWARFLVGVQGEVPPEEGALGRSVG